MKIWVDADACPAVIREILYKAAERTHSEVILVANRVLKIPRSAYIHFQKVHSGPDVADKQIIASVEPGDIVITSDIPLAAAIVDKGAIGLNPKGQIYTKENMGEILSTRDFLDTLRSSGIETGGPAGLTKRDRQSFANALDKTLMKQHG